MSLTEIDKVSNNRGNPVLNVDDSLPLASRMAHGTFGITLVNEDSGDVAKLVARDGRLTLEIGGLTYIDASEGNIETLNSGDVVARLGFRSSDSQGAVDVAKPGDAL